MDSEIIRISKNQNTITHKSGASSYFDTDYTRCKDCCYNNNHCKIGNDEEIPCVDFYRNDCFNGVFRIKK